jgi:hypothetical protein
MPSSWKWHHVDLVWTDVSEESIASIFRQKNPRARNQREQVTADSPKRRSHKIYTAPHPRRRHSLCSLPWKPQILDGQNWPNISWTTATWDSVHKTGRKARNRTPWPSSASELYRPSDRRTLTKLVPTIADRDCREVSAADPPRSLISVF